MGAVAEGLVCGVPAAAEPDGRSAGQTEGLSFRVKDFEFAFDAYRSVVIDRNFRGWHFFLLHRCEYARSAGQLQA
jgi:hypothetical protein